jgi:hypothetical protein
VLLATEPATTARYWYREFEYRRHGAQALIAGFDVTTGNVGGMVDRAVLLRR